MIKFIIFVMIALPVLTFIIQAIAKSNGKNKALTALEGLKREKGMQEYEYEQFDDGQIIVHDISNSMIWVVDTYGGWVGRSYKNIADVELIVDDAVEYKSSLSSSTGRAIVGGVLAGGVGAIIGGVTGKKNTSKVVHRIELILSYRNCTDIMYSRIILLDNPKGEPISSDRCIEEYESGLYWSKLISSL